MNQRGWPFLHSPSNGCWYERWLKHRNLTVALALDAMRLTNPKRKLYIREFGPSPPLGCGDFLCEVTHGISVAGLLQCQVGHRLNMARSKRRITRSNPQKSRERSPQLEPLSPLSVRSSLTPIPIHDEQLAPPEQAQEEAHEPVQETTVQSLPAAAEEDTCPACKDLAADVQSTVSKESWIRCDACKSWYHWVCAGNGTDVDTIDKWQVWAEATIIYITCVTHNIGTANHAPSRSLLGRSHSSRLHVNRHANVPNPTTPT